VVVATRTRALAQLLRWSGSGWALKATDGRKVSPPMLGTMVRATRTVAPTGTLPLDAHWVVLLRPRRHPVNGAQALDPGGRFLHGAKKGARAHCLATGAR
jgi:hypothetical protein